MTNILQQCGDLYIEKLREISQQAFDLRSAQGIFTNLDESDEVAIRKLVDGLIELLPELGKLIADKDNLPTDLALTAMIFTYLIMPFDIIPDDGNGLIGFLDDALVAFLLTDQLEEPDGGLRLIMNKHRHEVAELMTKLPEWFTRAIERYSVQARAQHQIMKSH
jgi:uncharacterized membrane protein YkvA (DUF1232 family)